MKKVKIINDGETQIINLPKAFEFEGEKVFIRKSGEEVVLSPYVAQKIKNSQSRRKA